MKRPELIVLAKNLGIPVGQKTNEVLKKEITKACATCELAVIRKEQGVNPATKVDSGERDQRGLSSIKNNMHARRVNAY